MGLDEKKKAPIMTQKQLVVTGTGPQGPCMYDHWPENWVVQAPCTLARVYHSSNWYKVNAGLKGRQLKVAEQAEKLSSTSTFATDASKGTREGA